MTQTKSIKEYGEIEFELSVDPDNSDIYLRFKGFSNLEDSEEYADYLLEHLPLMLFESDVKH